MSPTTAFFVGFAVLLTLAVGVLVFIRRPLHDILIELCGNVARARFWEVIYGASVVLTTAFGAMLYPPDPAIEGPVGLHGLLGMFRYGLAGLIGCVGLLAFLMMRFIVSYENDQRAGARVTPYSS